MATFPAIDLKGVRKKLRKRGYSLKRQGKHEIWGNQDGKIVMISRGNQQVGPTLLKMILDQMGVSKKEFFKP